jgi:hypothetical protein
MSSMAKTALRASMPWRGGDDALRHVAKAPTGWHPLGRRRKLLCCRGLPRRPLLQRYPTAQCECIYFGHLLFIDDKSTYNGVTSAFP